jgi:hypothetical protein
VLMQVRAGGRALTLGWPTLCDSVLCKGWAIPCFAIGGLDFMQWLTPVPLCGGWDRLLNWVAHRL